MWSVVQGAGEEGKEIAGLERVKLYFEGLNLHYSARLMAQTPVILSRGSSSVSPSVNSCSGSCHATSLGFDAFLLSYSVFCLHLVHSPVFSLKKANQCMCVHMCSRVCRCMCASACMWRPGDSLGCWPSGIVHYHFRDGVSHRSGNHKVGYGGWSAIPRIHLSPPLSTVIPSVYHHACLLLCGFWGSNVGPLRKTFHQLNLLLSFPTSFSKKPSLNNGPTMGQVPWTRY